MDDSKKEALAAFRQAVEADEELAQKARSATEAGDVQALVALAQEHGFALEEADFAPGGTAGSDARELSDEELDAVAGGHDIECSNSMSEMGCVIFVGINFWD